MANNLWPVADMDLVGRALALHYGWALPALKRDDPGVRLLGSLLGRSPDAVFMQMADMLDVTGGQTDLNKAISKHYRKLHAAAS